MRAVIQRVSSASVAVDGQVISQISRGLMVLVGIGVDDTIQDAEQIAKKIVTLRVFEDNKGSMWKANVRDIKGEILCVSQFTLMANTTKGNKPDFHKAMPSEASQALYNEFLAKVSDHYGQAGFVKDGRFGAMMAVSLVNEGPVTLTIDSRKFEYIQTPGSGSSQVNLVVESKE
ncbi:D-tyrosyl-tRNA(Tyr) deacylase [Tulasnella sp. 419]|nr:D-tyrosyl-tRNA(Tyr) deacylase [Tulasnella sp. 419]